MATRSEEGELFCKKKRSPSREINISNILAFFSLWRWEVLFIDTVQ